MITLVNDSAVIFGTTPKFPITSFGWWPIVIPDITEPLSDIKITMWV